MARGFRPKPTEAERLAEIAAETVKIIRVFKAERGIEHDKDIAALIGMDPHTLSAKFKNGTWTQKDLCKVISVLKIPAESAVKMLGVKA